MTDLHDSERHHPTNRIAYGLTLAAAALLFTGCESVEQRSDRACAEHGGVRELPQRYKVVVCNDGTTHQVNT